jgi:hypothetical protein
MKKRILLLFVPLSVFTFQYAQTNISDIEDITLPADTFYNGADQAGSFQSGNISYPSVYDTTFGGYWAGGFAASNMKDSVTSGYTNQYSAKTASGYAASDNYVVSQNNTILKLTGSSAGDSIYGFYVTNTTYAFNSMRDGDWIAKKFGGTSGNDPDWFLLTVKKYYGGVLSNDSVYFYLADYRFSNNSSDYILDSWQWVNCKPLGMADSILFTLTSSDNGTFGMNTPAYFAMDNLTTRASMVGIGEKRKPGLLTLSPNPSTGLVKITCGAELHGAVRIFLYDINGKLVFEESRSVISELFLDISSYQNGNYILKMVSDDEVYTGKISKQ